MTELARIDRRATELAEQYAGFTDAASLTDGEKVVALVSLVPMALTVVEEARDTIERLNTEIERLTAEQDQRQGDHMTGMIGPGIGQISEGNAREIDRQVIAFRKVVRLHAPMTLWLPHADADYSFESYEDAVEYVTDDLDNDREHDEQARSAAIAGITSFEVCAHCKNIESGQAEDRGYEYAAWPCRTAQCWVVT